MKVTQGALLKRINRKLAHDGEKVCKARAYWDGWKGPYFDTNTGEYYSIDVDRNFIVGTHLDLEAYGRELGVLAEHEAVQ